MVFEIGHGQELSEKEYFSILRLSSIMVFIGIMLMAVSYAENIEQSYSTSVQVIMNVYSINDSNANTVNVLVEGDNRTFSITNSTSSYTINFKRNASCSESTASNLSSSISALSSTCDDTISALSTTCERIVSAYGDTASYYQPLLECTTIRAQCEKEKEGLLEDKSSLVSVETNYNNCITEKTNLQSQHSTCSQELGRVQSNTSATAIEFQNVKSKANLYFWGLIVAVAVIAGYWYKNIYQKESKHPTEGIAPPRG